jgi:hypothetical protein
VSYETKMLDQNSGNAPSNSGGGFWLIMLYIIIVLVVLDLAASMLNSLFRYVFG